MNYSTIERHYIVLIFATQKLCHYLFPHSLNLVNRSNPLKYLSPRLAISRLIARWRHSNRYYSSLQVGCKVKPCLIS